MYASETTQAACFLLGRKYSGYRYASGHSRAEQCCATTPPSILCRSWMRMWSMWSERMSLTGKL
eukprot:scaffold45294_cov25-Tisochrysis_lutea.AAC.1